MGKTIFIAVISAIIASVVTALYMGALSKDSEIDERLQSFEERLDEERERVDVATKRSVELERRVTRAQRLARARPVESADGEPAATGVALIGEDGSMLSPDGTPYVSRAELEQALARRGLDGLASGGTPRKQQTLEEVAAEINLSAGEVDSLRIIMTDAEEELISLVMGDRPMQDVIADVLEAKEDERKREELITSAVNNMLKNVGRIMTSKKRTNRKVRNLLGKDRGNEFLQRDVKSVHGEEIENLLEDIFD